MRTLQILLGMLLVSSVAAADPCKEIETWTRTFTTKMQSIATKSADAAVTCTFNGPNDKLMEAIGKEAKASFKALTASDPTAHATCSKTAIAVTSFVNDEGKSAGERMGYAYSLCSTKVRAKLAEMIKAGKSEDEIGKVGGQLAQEWLQGILGS
jgi:hypothetical protein